MEQVFFMMMRGDRTDIGFFLVSACSSRPLRPPREIPGRGVCYADPGSRLAISISGEVGRVSYLRRASDG